MGTAGIGQRRDFEGLKQRRAQAARLFAKAKGRGALAGIARALEVSRQSVTRWYRQWRSGGIAALKGAGRAGRMPRLNAEQLRQVDWALRQGARTQGFGTDLWTLPRVAQVIERVSGVHYHPGHVWRVLRQMGWTLQRPARKARERNEEAIRQWIAERWPAVKKKPAANKRGSHSRTRAESRSDPRSAALGHPAAKPRS
jgi:transposase